ncbi:MAG: hypothetical protein QOJ03_853 [Frankiaceae bacterium]|nr:hypothetical protein [Frankiaceae bacterium]
MAENRRLMHGSCTAVWQVLSDGFTYSDWVVGTSAIRDVDEAWPAVGSALHYRIGRGRLSHEGHTEVQSMEPGRRLELEAHAWPVGTARIDLRLEDAADGCLVTIVEHPNSGLGSLLHNPVGDLLLKVRNTETLRRLERLARQPSTAHRQAPQR